MKDPKFDLLSETDIDRIIEMAWEDRTPFDAIQMQFDLAEKDVIELMRRELKPSSWRLWRTRVQGRVTKHAAQSPAADSPFRSQSQRTISHNKIPKR